MFLSSILPMVGSTLGLIVLAVAVSVAVTGSACAPTVAVAWVGIAGKVKVLLVPSGCLLASTAIALIGTGALIGEGTKPGTPLASSASIANSFLSRPYRSGKER
jgi:hypothetical protein